MSAPAAPARPGRRLTALALALSCLALARLGHAADPAPAPRPQGAPAPVARAMSPEELDRALIAEVKANTELMKNLEHLSDVIGPRLTGSRQLERANNWTAEKMKEYGLENVRLEPWEIPVGWERGTASMKIVEPDTGRTLMIAAAGWSGSTKGKVTGDVVILKARTRDELQQYKGKLKNAVVLRAAPSNVAPITDLRYGPVSGPPAKKDEPKKDEPKKEVKDTGEDEPAAPSDGQPPAKEQPPTKKDDGKKDDQPPRKGGGFGDAGFQADLNDFLRAEGVACVCTDSAKPHGLLVVSGGWGRGDRGAAQEAIARVYMAHEHYAMLYRLASRPAPAVTRVEVEISNTFVPGPVVVYNTVGEVRGGEKPDEFVVVGAHLDSWDLASGTTDNGTGSCVVLETARAVAALARQGYRPKRTIRFVLFTGEEQGLHGSRVYVQKAKERGELARHSAALVHDTGTGRVYGFGLQGRSAVQKVLEPELTTLKEVDGWRGLDLGRQGGTDHLPFEAEGVPGFACRQDVDEYRLTHHTQTDTFDHAKGPNLVQGAQVMAVTCVRIANLAELLPRQGGGGGGFGGGGFRKKDGTEPKKDAKKE